jgi:hypothetical protein
MHCSIICYLCSSKTLHVYISVSWIPYAVSFLSRSYFFPGPGFACVVSHMCAGAPVKYSCRRHFSVCLAHCWCKAFSYQVSSIPHTPFYRSWFSFVVRLGFFVHYIHCSIIYYLCSSETSPMFYLFHGSQLW